MNCISRKLRALAALTVVGALACSSAPIERPDRPAAHESENLSRRVVVPTVAGERVRVGISYGPYRAGQRPGGPSPSEAEIVEDLRLIAPRWSMIRVYGARAPTETILRVIREHQLPLTVMVGAWIDPEPTGAAANRAEVSEAIRLARSFSDVVFAVSVGNETQVFWSGHRVAPDVLIRYIRQVRAAVAQPVTTADDYNFWNKPESRAIAAELDFVVLHAYAMWNKQTIDTAVAWTRTQIEAIERAHPTLEIYLGETGWATERNPEAGGDEAVQVIGVASEERQRTFYRNFVHMADELGLSYFYFEAFDEPWKGSDHPKGIEKHWGLFCADRTPKLAISR